MRRVIDLKTRTETTHEDAPPTPVEPKPTNSEIYDQAMQNNKLLKAITKAINKGTLVVGANLTNQELKQVIKDQMNGG